MACHCSTTVLHVMLRNSIGEITSLWLFVVSLFSSNRLATKRGNGSVRIMAQNAWNWPRMCLLGFRQKWSPHQPPNSEKCALQKPFFVQNTHKSWRKCHQNSYSNRKQPIKISNLGLKIWPEVEIWPFMRMHSKKLAKTTWNRGPISKMSRHVANRARRSQIWGRILHRK